MDITYKGVIRGHGKRSIALTVGGVILAMGFIGTVVSRINGSQYLAWGSGIGMAIGIALVVVYWAWTRLLFGDVNKDRVERVDGTGNLEQLIDDYEKLLDVGKMSLIAEMVLNPSKYIEQLFEQVSLNTRSTHIVQKYLVALPTEHIGEGERIFLPLIYHSRGKLLDSLRLTEASGESRIMTGREAVALCCATIRRYLASQILNNGEETKVLQAYKAGPEKRVIAYADAGMWHDRQKTDLDSILSDIDELLPAGQGRRDDLPDVLKALSCIGQEYPSVIECLVAPKNGGEGTHLKFTVESREIMPRGSGERLSKIMQGLYDVFAVRSPNICYPLNNAERTQSYHLEVVAPEGFYMRTQQIRQIGGAISAGDAPSPIASRIAVQKAYGQRRAHLYLRDARQTAGDEFVCMFEERTPGTAGYTTVASLACAFIVFICGYLQMNIAPVIAGLFSGWRISPNVLSGIHTLSSGGGNGDVVVALLAIPPAVGAWLGMKSADRLVFGSLWSRFSIIITVIICLVGSGTFVYFNGHNGEPVFAWTLWSTLVCLSVVNAVLSGSRWFVKARFEMDRVREASENKDFE